MENSKEKQEILHILNLPIHERSNFKIYFLKKTGEERK